MAFLTLVSFASSHRRAASVTETVLAKAITGATAAAATQKDS